MMILKDFVMNDMGVNSFVLHDESGSGILVDPACQNPVQQEQLNNYLLRFNIKPVAIVNTHGHFDHVMGNAWAKREYACPLFLHEEDLYLVRHASEFAAMFGFSSEPSPDPDGFLNEGTPFCFGHSELRIFHVPGHSPGSICLYAATEGWIICGDVLFRQGIGRTDLPGGDHALLVKGIRDKLMTLPPLTVVWPGHGPTTSIGEEYDTNPFLS